jgi:hypothetical protein
MPWTPPERFHLEMASPYAGEITFCDEQLGRMLDWLSDQSRDRNLLTIVTSDHGEALGDHGESNHGMLLYQSTLHVPLIVHGPWVASSQGARVPHPVGTVDLAATILDVAGLAKSQLPDVLGSSLIVDGAPATSDRVGPIYVETFSPYYTYRWAATRGVVWNEHKLIDARDPELYDLGNDPGETDNLVESDADRVADLQAKMGEMLARGSLGWGEERSLASGERQMLEALGYVEGSLGDDPFSPSLASPRERLEQLKRISHGMAVLNSALTKIPDDPAERAKIGPKKRRLGIKLLNEARDIFLALREEDPHNPDLYVRLGRIEALLENYEAALPLLERGVAARPRNAPIRYHLALTYWALGRDAEARDTMRTMIAIEPDRHYYKIWLKSHPMRKSESGEPGRADQMEIP